MMLAGRSVLKAHQSPNLRRSWARGDSMVWTGPVGRSVRKALVRRASSALVLALAVLALTVTSTVRASESDSGGAHDSFQVHGFVSQGFILTLHNDYIVDDSTDGSFEFSEVGINFTQP